MLACRHASLRAGGRMRLQHAHAAEGSALGGFGNEEQYTRPVELEKPFGRMRERDPRK